MLMYTSETKTDRQTDRKKTQIQIDRQNDIEKREKETELAY